MKTEVPYESTDANVTLGPFARTGLPGRMIAWLELLENDARTPMIAAICISVFAVLVFLSLIGPAGSGPDSFRSTASFLNLPMPHERPDPPPAALPISGVDSEQVFVAQPLLAVLVFAIFAESTSIDDRKIHTAKSGCATQFPTAKFKGKELRGRLVPVWTGTSGPEDRSRRLPLPSGRTARRTVTAQRARTHPQAWAQRRRDIVERSATIAAEFSSGVGRPQPVAASRALRIDALHSPSRQILHAFSPSWNDAPIFSVHGANAA